MAGLVLVVEDEVIIARDIAFQVRELGYELIGVAHTGEQALALVSIRRPDLAIMDIHLGIGMNGFATASELASRFGVPSLFISAFITASDNSIDAFPESFGRLAKPFTDMELSDSLAQAFEKIGLGLPDPSNSGQTASVALSRGEVHPV